LARNKTRITKHSIYFEKFKLKDLAVYLTELKNFRNSISNGLQSKLPPLDNLNRLRMELIEENSKEDLNLGADKRIDVTKKKSGSRSPKKDDKSSKNSRKEKELV
jgi:hypothetical protein